MYTYLQVLICAFTNYILLTAHCRPNHAQCEFIAGINRVHMEFLS